MSELELLRQQVTTLTTQLTEAQNQLAATNKEFVSSQTELKGLKDERAALDGKMETLQNRISIYEQILPTTLTDTKPTPVDQTVDVDNLVNDILEGE